MSSNTFSSVSSSDLATISGGADPAKQGPSPTSITGGDVAEVGFKAAKGVLNPVKTVASNGVQAFKQYNDPRIKDAGWDVKALNAFCGVFGIDPLKNFSK